MKSSSDDNSVPIKPISTNNSDSKVHSRGARLFGSIIDVNSPPRRLRSPIRSSMLINIGDSHLKSPALPCKLALFSAQSTMNNNNNPDECNKASSKFAALLENCPIAGKSIDSKSTPGKRKYFDENSTVSKGNDYPLPEDDDCHRAKRVSTKKKKVIAKSEPVSPVKDDNEHSSQTTISVLPKKPLSAIQSQSKPSTSSSTQNSRSITSIVVDLYSKEQQLKWMTEKNGQNDLGYYHVLIEQLFKALEETWAQNDQLEAEIRELEEENQVLEPMFQQIIELKQMLFGEDEAEDVEDEATA